MKITNAGRVIATTVVAAFAAATMSGAFALPPIQDEFNQCLDNATGGDIESIDVAKRIGCCKQAGGAWVEIYDADGNVVDGFCDGAEEVYEPEESRQVPNLNPAVRDNEVQATALDPAPAADVNGESKDTSAIASPCEPTDAPAVEAAASDPAPAAPAEAPAKVKRHRHRHHKRH